jgi:hypothetical protein
LLLNGEVLFTGGNDFGNLSRVELYDSATGTFAGAGNMSLARNGHSATLLPDSTVLVAAARVDPGALAASCERRDLRSRHERILDDRQPDLIAVCSHGDAA